MDNGLKNLRLADCSLHTQDISCLVMSKHTQILLQVDLSDNYIENDSAAVVLISLCLKLKYVKVISVNGCGLEYLSPNTVSSVVKAFTKCESL